MRATLRRWFLPALLLAVAAFTTTFCGATLNGSPFTLLDLPQLIRYRELGDVMHLGLPFAATFLAIMLAHEFGHFFAARAHGVEASPPYFIPLPFGFGTLGAVMTMRGRFLTRRSLVDMGASGPWAGFAVALPALILGLSWSDWSAAPPPSPWLPNCSAAGVAAMATVGVHHLSGVLQEGSGALYCVLVALVRGRAPDGMVLQLHPAAVGAWFGLFITGLNLIPIGQLDGGHVLYALVGERSRLVGRIMLVLLGLLGLFCWVGWWLWALIGWKLLRTGHPPVTDPGEPMGRGRRVVAWASLALFLLTFVPVPFELR